MKGSLVLTNQARRLFWFNPIKYLTSCMASSSLELSFLDKKRTKSVI